MGLNKMKIYNAVKDLGCYYRLNNSQLEYAIAMLDNTFDTNEFYNVEPDLVGEEEVTFLGVDTNLYGVFETVTKILTNKE